MTLLVSILIILVCLLLIGIILIQKPKGGGLGSSFGGSANMLGGVQKTNEFLDKATWGLATALLVLVLSTNITGAGSAESTEGDVPATSQRERGAGTVEAPANSIPMGQINQTLDNSQQEDNE